MSSQGATRYQIHLYTRSGGRWIYKGLAGMAAGTLSTQSQLNQVVIEGEC
jgi:hypothetical protein